MTRYHISEETDRVNICRAQSVDTCPLKSESGETFPHFNNKQKALAYKEKRLADKAAKEGKSFGTLKKINDNKSIPEKINAGSGTYSAASAMEKATAAYEKSLEEQHSQVKSVAKTARKNTNNLYHINLKSEKVFLCKSFDPARMCGFKEHGHYKTLEEAQVALDKLTGKTQTIKTQDSTNAKLPVRNNTKTQAQTKAEPPSVPRNTNNSPETKKKSSLMSRILGRENQTQKFD